MEIFGVDLEWTRYNSFSLQNQIENAISSISQNNNEEKVVENFEMNYILKLQGLTETEKNDIMKNIRTYAINKRRIFVELREDPFRLNYINYTGLQFQKPTGVTNSGGTLEANKTYLYAMATKEGSTIGSASNVIELTTDAVKKSCFVLKDGVIGGDPTELRYYRSADDGKTWYYLDTASQFILDNGGLTWTRIYNFSGQFMFDFSQIKPVFSDGTWAMNILLKEKWYI